MSPIRGYINEESEHSAFVVYTTQRNSRRSPVESNIAPCDEIGNFQPLEDFHSKMFDFNPMDTIKEQSTTLILTNPKLSSTLLFDMDVFGQTLDSVDVWSEEDVFSWTRMNHLQRPFITSINHLTNAAPSISYRRSIGVFSWYYRSHSFMSLEPQNISTSFQLGYMEKIFGHGGINSTYVPKLLSRENKMRIRNMWQDENPLRDLDCNDYEVLVRYHWPWSTYIPMYRSGVKWLSQVSESKVNRSECWISWCPSQV